MPADRTAMELVTLNLLDGSDGPVGSPRLLDALRRTGIDVAEATAGRFLSQLDQRGLSRVMNHTKGRVITEAGRQRLEELQALERQDQYGALVLGAVRATELAELLDLLYVRRLVEVEATRLAAIRATEEEIDQIFAFAEAHVDPAADDHHISAASMCFHRMVAEASHNRMLSAVTLLLLDPGNDPLEQMLELFALDAGVTDDHVADHFRIAAALRARDARSAEVAMSTHMDKLIEVAHTYRTRLSKSSRTEFDYAAIPCASPPPL